MKEKIEEISLSMERGHRRVLRVLSALAVIGLFAAFWKWRGLAAMQPLVEGRIWTADLPQRRVFLRQNISKRHSIHSIGL